MSALGIITKCDMAVKRADYARLLDLLAGVALLIALSLTLGALLYFVLEAICHVLAPWQDAISTQRDFLSL